MSNTNELELVAKLLATYDKVMYLKIFVDSNEKALKEKYRLAALQHNLKLINNDEHFDAGFDLFAPSDGVFVEHLIKVDYEISCSARMYTGTKDYNTGYFMYPRSSLSKTPLRLANSTGIIDSGYRGHLIGMFDHTESGYRSYLSGVIDTEKLEAFTLDAGINPFKNQRSRYDVKMYDRWLQICAPGLVPIVVEVVDSSSDLGDQTERGSKGLGSSGR
jgi:dUTP pyrophosphatase